MFGGENFKQNSIHVVSWLLLTGLILLYSLKKKRYHTELAQNLTAAALSTW